MTHPATRRAVAQLWRALHVETVALGFVEPGQADDRGRALWIPAVDGARLSALLPRAAAANARGLHIYLRIEAGDTDAGAHPGVLLLDDVPFATLTVLRGAGFAPVAVVETSPRNFQVWVRLVEPGQTITRGEAQRCVRRLARQFGADPRAVSPVQPGRLVGFTNRKPKHQTVNGLYPFVRLIEASGATAPGGAALLADIRAEAAQPAARCAPAKTPPLAAVDRAAAVGDLDRIRAAVARRIADQVRAGTRPSALASASEVDWNTVRMALRSGHDPAVIIPWLEATRPDHSASYATRTVTRALAAVECQASSESRSKGP